MTFHIQYIGVTFNHLRTDDEILVKIPISTVADDKILVIRSTYILIESKFHWFEAQGS